MDFRNENDEIINLYFREKCSIKNIARRTNTSRNKVASIIKEKKSSFKNEEIFFDNSHYDKVDSFIKENSDALKIPFGCRIIHLAEDDKIKEKSDTIFLNFFNKNAYCMTPLPGELAEFCWLDCGIVDTENSKRKLTAFLMYLHHSGQFFVKFFHSNCQYSLLKGFSDAFNFFGGVPRKVIIANTSTCLNKKSDYFIKYEKEILLLSKHYHFEPTIKSAERYLYKTSLKSIKIHLKSKFLSQINFESIHKINEDIKKWILKNNERNYLIMETSNQLIGNYIIEQEFLKPLPKKSIDLDERKKITLGKSTHVFFDSNKYSLPSSFSNQKIEMVISDSDLEFYSNGKIIEKYIRSYGRKLSFKSQDKIDKTKSSQKIYGNNLIDNLEHNEDIKHFLEENLKIENQNNDAIKVIKYLGFNYGVDFLFEAIEYVVVNETPKISSLIFTVKNLSYEAQKKNISPIEIRTGRYSEIVINHHNSSHYDKLAGVKNDNRFRK